MGGTKAMCAEHVEEWEIAVWGCSHVYRLAIQDSEELLYFLIHSNFKRRTAMFYAVSYVLTYSQNDCFSLAFIQSVMQYLYHP
jgi:hypothetical protein